MTTNNGLNNTLQSPFTLGVTSVTSTGSQLNLLSGASQTLVQQVYNETSAVATGTNLFFYNNTIPTNTQGTQYMSQTITPKSASNILVIEVLANLSSTTPATDVIMGCLFQDSNVNAIAQGIQAIAEATLLLQVVLRKTMVAGTTSATTFNFRAAQTGPGTMTFNGTSGAGIGGGVLLSSMRITEYTP